ncbi:hypothetical protein PR202_gb15038 [Eleusine coracana subsp. coracana]|uniref:DUF4220 domain-containing protein n=1 Tax=Eleusine coracana subsp. coracana TaxID=191504 RepID=A0AAV5EXT3_ELECO|nr:hypothetical protein PR202_gb15038 [Eleusine coracana subsp. coracana]
MHQLRDLWRSPRGTVLRIEALALVAIGLSFFLAAFGSCRRWSSRWIIQKGFLAAQVLSLSLGTYSIGLMQSSSVKSEMYPVWAVSLLTLFGCVDPVTTYIGLDYKGPLLKLIFQLCLYCGYVVLMSVSTMSSSVGKLAIIVLCAITFFKGLHRSMALVLPSKQREQLGLISHAEPGALAGESGALKFLYVHIPIHYVRRDWDTTAFCWDLTDMSDIHSLCDHMGEVTGLEVTTNGMTIEDVCLGCSLSYLLQRRFLGLDTAEEMEEKREKFESLLRAGRAIDYKRSLKVIEVELAILYEVLFTSNEYLHFYEAKGCSLWAVASFLGIGFVGVAAAIPGTMVSSSSNRGSSCAAVVGTTRGDLVITLVIFVSLAALQLMQLIRCWTSSWVGVALACKYQRYQRRNHITIRARKNWLWWWIRTKAFVVARISDLFDGYLWQDQLGQYPLVAASSRRGCLQRLRRSLLVVPRALVVVACKVYNRFPGMLGLQYIARVLRELLLDSDAKGGAAVRLHDDVKASIAGFLGQRYYPLVVSAPELLPGLVTPIKSSFDGVASVARTALSGSGERNVLAAMREATTRGPHYSITRDNRALLRGVRLGRRLRNEIPPPRRRRRYSDPWELLALLWVQTLLYVAPYGDVQAHMKHLSQGGEFITHLWALLYHLGIDKWKLVEPATAEQENKQDFRKPEADAETSAAGSSHIIQEPPVA